MRRLFTHQAARVALLVLMLVLAAAARTRMSGLQHELAAANERAELLARLSQVRAEQVVVCDRIVRAQGEALRFTLQRLGLDPSTPETALVGPPLRYVGRGGKE
jgi:hypothetical protein